MNRVKIDDIVIGECVEESLDENKVHVHRLVHELTKCKSHKRLNYNNQSSETSLIVQVYVFRVHRHSCRYGGNVYGG